MSSSLIPTALSYLSVLIVLVFMKVMTQYVYLKIKYRDDGRELVTWLEFATIHCTFPFLNAWISYYLAYQISICIFTILKTKGALLQKLGISLYFVLTLENLVYLAYFKDVMFCSAVVAEFCGMFYFANKPDTSITE